MPESIPDPCTKGWHATLQLHYRRQGARTVLRHAHQGPLRVLKSLYPEGEAICHNVLVHPPSGLVGGDALDIALELEADTHALLTTPGASRFYRSEGPPASQRTRAVLQPGARLEWLPMETLCYSGCHAENRLSLRLAREAEAMAWDVTALGLPAAGRPFEQGELLQSMDVERAWLEQGRIRAADARLLSSPLGLAGRRCLATLCFASGSDIARARREQALETAHALVQAHALAGWAGATSPQAQVLVLRALAPAVEPAMDLLRSVRKAWRAALWGLAANPPRTWAL